MLLLFMKYLVKGWPLILLTLRAIIHYFGLMLISCKQSGDSKFMFLCLHLYHS